MLEWCFATKRIKSSFMKARRTKEWASRLGNISSNISGITLLRSKCRSMQNRMAQDEYQTHQPRYSNHLGICCQDFGQIVLSHSLKVVSV